MSDVYETQITVEVHATQWDGTAHDAMRVINWAIARGYTARYACLMDSVCSGQDDGHFIQLVGIDGGILDGGSWLVVGSRGLRFLNNEDFRREFAPVDAELMRKA